MHLGRKGHSASGEHGKHQSKQEQVSLLQAFSEPLLCLGEVPRVSGYQRPSHGTRVSYIFFFFSTVIIPGPCAY
jgi:hypothetical protein